MTNEDHAGWVDAWHRSGLFYKSDTQWVNLWHQLAKHTKCSETQQPNVIDSNGAIVTPNGQTIYVTSRLPDGDRIAEVEDDYAPHLVWLTLIPEGVRLSRTRFFNGKVGEECGESGGRMFWHDRSQRRVYSARIDENTRGLYAERNATLKHGEFMQWATDWSDSHLTMPAGWRRGVWNFKAGAPPAATSK